MEEVIQEHLSELSPTLNTQTLFLSTQFKNIFIFLM